jgi:PAS domain S-box-containing protein
VPVIAAALPPDEKRRLDDLRALAIEPTSDAVLEDIVSIAAEICEAPIALITIVEEDRQWFKAAVGFDEPETSRDVAFCAHAILDPGAVMVVEDATVDERFSDNPLVTGEPHICFYAGVPLVTQGGQPLGSICVIDHVPRALTEAQRARLRRLGRLVVAHLEARRDAQQLLTTEIRAAAVVEHALDAIVSTDADMTIVGWNPGAERCFGFSEEQALGAHLNDLIVPPAYRQAQIDGMRRYLETRRPVILDRRIELSALHADGHEFPIELTVTEVATDPPLFTAHIRDITDRKVAQRVLEEQNEKLRDLDRMRDDFVARVSHELRTPTAAISSLVELLSEDASLPARPRELLDTVHRSAQRLVRLVDDLLFLTADDAGQARLLLGPVDVRTVVSDAAALALSEAERRTIRVDASCALEEPVAADRVRIAQALDNLLGNALRFTPEGGTIQVSAAPEGEASWRLDVTDSGVGIPPDELGRIFDRFFRASTAVEKAIHGTGLGLAIVQAIVTAHGGTIDVTSTVGEGTTVSLILPRTPPANDETQQ